MKVYGNNKLASWLTRYFHKSVFLMVVNPLLFIRRHEGMHKVKNVRIAL
jgi:hypothetical protein